MDDANDFQPRVLACSWQLRAFDLAVELECSEDSARALAGSLIHAAGVVVEELLGDLDVLTTFEGASSKTRRKAEAALMQLDHLPPRYAHRYDRPFAGDFLVAMVDLTGRLTRDAWEMPSCTAQELGVGLLLDRVEMTSGLADLTPRMPMDWRELMEELMLADTDHQLLYQDGFHPATAPDHIGVVYLDFDEWFKPFNTADPRLPPYLLDR